MPLWTMCRPHSSNATPPIKSRTTIVPIVIRSRPRHRRATLQVDMVPRSGTCGGAAHVRHRCRASGAGASGEAAACADVSVSSADRQLEHLANLRADRAHLVEDELHVLGADE